MAPHAEKLKLLRVVVREDFSRHRCETLIRDLNAVRPLLILSPSPLCFMFFAPFLYYLPYHYRGRQVMKQLDDTPKAVHEHMAKVHEEKKKQMHPSQKYVSILNPSRNFNSFAQLFNPNTHSNSITRFHPLNVLFARSFALFHLFLGFILGARRGMVLERWVLTILFVLFGVGVVDDDGGGDVGDNRQKHQEKHSLQGKHGKTHGIC